MSSLQVITQTGPVGLVQVLTLPCGDILTNLPGQAGCVDCDGIEIHGLTVTASHEVRDEVKLRLVPPVPAPTTRVEVDVTYRDQTAVEGGVGVNGINELSVPRVEPGSRA